MRSIISVFWIHVSTALAAKDYRRLVEDNLELIDQVVGFVAKAQGLRADERDSLNARVKLKLVERDYEILRRYEGRASLKTYLVVVAQSVCLDYRNQRWGKWRPSCTARRLGETAIRLEAAMTRDGLSQAEAVARLKDDPSVALSAVELIHLAEQLPQRNRRRHVDDAGLDSLPGTEPDGERQLLDGHRRELLAQVETTMTQALAEHSTEDQLIVKMHYFESLKISQIAHLLGLDQKHLYRRVERLLNQLRASLEAAGHSSPLVRGLLRDG